MNMGGDLLNLACEKIAELEVPAFIKDSELRYVVVNEAYARFFREAPEAFAGKTDRELFGRLEDGVRDDRERQVVVFGDEQTTLVFDPFGHDRYPLRIERFFGDDDAIYVFGMFEEAPRKAPKAKCAGPSKTRQAAGAAARTEPCGGCGDALFRATLEDLPVATYVRDELHRMVFANSAFLEIIGQPLQQLVGKTEQEIFPDRGDRYHADNCRVLEDGEAMEVEDFFVRNDGVTVPVISRASRIVMPNGARYMVGSVTDISVPASAHSTRTRVGSASMRNISTTRPT